MSNIALVKLLNDQMPERKIHTHGSHSDEDAFSDMVRLHYEELYKYAVKFTKNAQEAKDQVNEFFIHVWEKRSLFLSSEQPKNYLLSSFKNFLIRRHTSLRRDKRNHLLYVSGIEDKEPPYEDYLLLNQHENALKQSLQTAISKLPARQKELLQLRFYEHLSYEEIAKKTSLEIRTVYNKLHEAIKSLRRSEIIHHLRKSLFFFL